MADTSKPYGDVAYADPGYQKDGKKRYPIDTEAHCRAAWSYINQASNAAQYTAEQLAAIKAKIKAAGKKFGITFEDSTSSPAGRGFTAVDDEVDNSERRYTSGLVEVRQLDGRGPRIGGYAALFDKPSRNLGGFVEVVTRSFFDEARAGGWPDVLCRYNHDDNYLLGTTPNTLTLNLDTVGLRYDVEPPQARRDVLELVERGDVKKSSFAFRKIEDDWTTSDQGYPLRKLVIGELVDVAPVNLPAYTETTAKMRSLEFGLRSLAEKVDAAIEEVRAAAEVNDLRRFLVRTDGPPASLKPKPLFGPAALVALEGKRYPSA
jgi:uncharacterized protein